MHALCANQFNRIQRGRCGVRPASLLLPKVALTVALRLRSQGIRLITGSVSCFRSPYVRRPPSGRSSELCSEEFAARLTHILASRRTNASGQPTSKRTALSLSTATSSPAPSTPLQSKASSCSRRRSCRWTRWLTGRRQGSTGRSRAGRRRSGGRSRRHGYILDGALHTGRSKPLRRLLRFTVEEGSQLRSVLPARFSSFFRFSVVAVVASSASLCARHLPPLCTALAKDDATAEIG